MTVGTVLNVSVDISEILKCHDAVIPFHAAAEIGGNPDEFTLDEALSYQMRLSFPESAYLSPENREMFLIRLTRADREQINKKAHRMLEIAEVLAETKIPIEINGKVGEYAGIRYRKYYPNRSYDNLHLEEYQAMDCDGDGIISLMEYKSDLLNKEPDISARDLKAKSGLWLRKLIWKKAPEDSIDGIVTASLGGAFFGVVGGLGIFGGIEICAGVFAGVEITALAPWGTLAMAAVGIGAGSYFIEYYKIPDYSENAKWLI